MHIDLTGQTVIITFSHGLIKFELETQFAQIGEISLFDDRDQFDLVDVWLDVSGQTDVSDVVRFKKVKGAPGEIKTLVQKDKGSYIYVLSSVLV